MIVSGPTSSANGSRQSAPRRRADRLPFEDWMREERARVEASGGRAGCAARARGYSLSDIISASTSSKKGGLGWIRETSSASWKTDRKSTRLNSSHGYISYAV